MADDRSLTSSSGGDARGAADCRCNPPCSSAGSSVDTVGMGTG